MNKSGVWKSLESKPAEADEGEQSKPASKAATPDEGIVIKVRQLDGCEDNWELVHINEKTLLFYQASWCLIKTCRGMLLPIIR